MLSSRTFARLDELTWLTATRRALVSVQMGLDHQHQRTRLIAFDQKRLLQPWQFSMIERDVDHRPATARLLSALWPPSSCRNFLVPERI